VKKSEISRLEVFRTGIALAIAIAILATGSIALPSLATADDSEVPPVKGPQLETEEILNDATHANRALASIESLRDSAAKLSEPAKKPIVGPTDAVPEAAVAIANATRAVAKPVATGGLKAVPSAAGFVRATAHEAIKMKKGIIPLIPAKFRRAEEGVTIPVSLTQYCVQGETRRGRQTRHGILAADPRIFPLARYVDVYLGTDYLGRYLVDDTGGNVLGATLDIWNPNCREARKFGRHWGSAVLVAREVEQIPVADAPIRWEGLAER
jgi:3D (Asp-Asp-Asp) domain-containing protein